MLSTGLLKTRFAYYKVFWIQTTPFHKIDMIEILTRQSKQCEFWIYRLDQFFLEIVDVDNFVKKISTFIKLFRIITWLPKRVLHIV